MILSDLPSNPRGVHYNNPYFTDKDRETWEGSDLPTATHCCPGGWTQDPTQAMGLQRLFAESRAESVWSIVGSVVPSRKSGME